MPTVDHRSFGIAETQPDGLATVLDTIVNNRHGDGLGGFPGLESQNAPCGFVVIPGCGRHGHGFIFHPDPAVKPPVEGHGEQKTLLPLVSNRISHRYLWCGRNG